MTDEGLADVDICVVGGGPAALLACDVLTAAGRSVLLLADELYGALQPVSAGGLTFNWLPVFPVEGTQLAKRLGAAGCLDGATPLDVCEASSGTETTDLTEPGSRFALFSRRLFGIAGPPYPKEVRLKAMRHYDNMVVRRRLGFVDGLSPYYLYCRSLPRAPRRMFSGARFDFLQRSITIEPETIRYRALLWTRSLPTLHQTAAVELNLPPCTFTSGDAAFAAFRCSRPLIANRLVYDRSEASPLYRAFTLHANAVLVQYCHGTDLPLQIDDRLSRLLAVNAVTFDHLHSVRAPSAYPLDLTPDEARNGLLERLRQHSIIPFGRLGQWQYLDLDELDWDRVARVAATGEIA